MFWHDLGQQLRQQFATPEKAATYLMRAVQIAVIVALALLVYLVARTVIRRLLRGDGRLAHERRARTALALTDSVTAYTILFIAIVMCLRVLGVDYAAILAGAGVVGLAVGFGAQTLIRDFIAGFFLLIEDLVSVGDWITVGDVSGTVEQVGLRITRVRAFDGTLHVIPNGELTRFGNKSRGHMRAIVTFDLAYEQDAEKGMALAREVAEQWYKENGDIAIEMPAVVGLLKFGESGVQVQASVKVAPGRQWGAEQQLRLRLKQAFDSAGIEIPLPQRVVHVRRDEPAP